MPQPSVRIKYDGEERIAELVFPCGVEMTWTLAEPFREIKRALTDPLGGFIYSAYAHAPPVHVKGELLTIHGDTVATRIPFPKEMRDAFVTAMDEYESRLKARKQAKRVSLA